MTSEMLDRIIRQMYRSLEDRHKVVQLLEVFTIKTLKELARYICIQLWGTKSTMVTTLVNYYGFSLSIGIGQRFQKEG